MPSRAPRHAARRRDGDIAPYRNGTAQRARAGGRARGVGCQAAHRAVARRRVGDIAPYRNGTAQRERTTGHGRGSGRGGGGSLRAEIPCPREADMVDYGA